MNWIEGAMWGLTGLSLVGVVANIYKRPWCFLVWFWTNLAWVAYDVHKGAWPQAALMAVYVILSAAGYVAWRRKR